MNTVMSKYEKRDYYNVSSIECIDIIEDLNLSFSCGNAFKYLYRSNNLKPKGEINDDLNKAIYYLNKMLSNPRVNRNPKLTKYITSINISLFNTAIYNAIIKTLTAGTSDNLDNYRLYIHEAIADIEFILFNAHY